MFNDKIYIVEGYNGLIVLFDPELKTYTKKQNIPKIGKNPNAVIISNKIRIFNGKTNSKYDIIYNITNDSVKINQFHSTMDKRNAVSPKPDPGSRARRRLSQG